MSCVSFNVTSETGSLRRVLVHTPGAEMERVSPSNRKDLLFEDILYLSQARAEHELMCAVFEKIVGGAGAVLQISELLKEAFQEEDARYEFIAQLCRILSAHNLQAVENELRRLEPGELCAFALTGSSPIPVQAPPLPNLMFMRDVAAVVCDHIVLSHPATAARARESIIMHVVLRYHPAFEDCRDRVVALPKGVTFEGGDLLVPSDHTVLIGSSERTSFGGVMSVAKHLIEKTSVENVIMVNLPKDRACMHLDTVFTFASETECMVYPPLIELSGLNNVVCFSKSDDASVFHARPFENLKQALETHLNRTMTFAACGGSDALSQQREQWTDGANLFAVAPGVVMGYERNSRSFEELAKLGYRVVSTEGFLSYHAESDFEPGEKIAVKLDGNELSRGRGGPRCLTMPLERSRPR
jgi:arginine deiminase